MPLTQSAPVYLQSGAEINMKGARNSSILTGSARSHFKSYAVQIPVLVTLDLAIGKHTAIVPEIGLFYSFAFTGSLDAGEAFYRPDKKQLIEVGSEIVDSRLMHRSDFGLRAGLSLRYARCLFGFAYDAGLVNIFAKDIRDAGSDAQSGSWSLNIGYRFGCE